MTQPRSITMEEIRITLGDSIPPGVTGQVRRRVGVVLDHLRQPVLSARVRMTRQPDPAVSRPVTAQANIDINGRVVRVQVSGSTIGEVLAQLEEKLRHNAERAAAQWKDRTGRKPSLGPGEWRHASEPAHRPGYFPRPPEERQIVRHKAYGLRECTVDEAAFDMDTLDYDFHLFTELGTGQDSVLYRAGPAGYRLAQLTPEPDQVIMGSLPVTISAKPAAVLTNPEAMDRLNLSGQPFLFFRHPDSGRTRGRVLYRRYDGHYGLITHAD